MEAILLIGLDGGLDLNWIKMVVEQMGTPIDELSSPGRQFRARNENYVESIVPLYSNNLFKEHFRMTRVSFEILINEIGNIIIIGQNNPVELNKKILFTIWMLAKQESFLSVGDRFGLAKSTGHGIFCEIIAAILKLMPQYIKWPNRQAYDTISRVFEQRSNGLPNVIGAIDGCHIPCKQPIDNPNDYYNRKGFHSIILQGVCDNMAQFTDICVGMPGRMHNARVFRNSPLYRDIINVENPLIPSRYHIIGDTAYPLMESCMTPIKDNGYLSRSQIAYNKKLSSIRSIIERAFARLKGKFRRLKYLDISDFQLGNEIIAACCILHNFIIDRNEIDEYEINAELDENLQNEEAEDEENLNAPNNARHKRNYLISLF